MNNEKDHYCNSIHVRSDAGIMRLCTFQHLGRRPRASQCLQALCRPCGTDHAYIGGIYDAATGLYYLNARYYDPSLAAFTTRDTYLGSPSNPDSWNLYGYCAGDPVNGIDPTGHASAYPGSLMGRKYKNGSNDSKYIPFIKEIQRELNSRGYADANGNKLVVDGKFEQMTEVCVKKFQNKNYLTPDGIVGKDTWNRLFRFTSSGPTGKCSCGKVSGSGRGINHNYLATNKFVRYICSHYTQNLIDNLKIKRSNIGGATIVGISVAGDIIPTVTWAEKALHVSGLLGGAISIATSWGIAIVGFVTWQSLDNTIASLEKNKSKGIIIRQSWTEKTNPNYNPWQPNSPYTGPKYLYSFKQSISSQ